MSMEKAPKDTAERQAELQLESVCEMVDRLRHARECEDETCEEHDHGYEDCPENGEECSNVAEYHDEDKAREAITQDALDVQVRSGWESLNQIGEDGLEPQSFAILLCTGGPAVRIVGKLEGGYPVRAQIEYQDWYTPWKRLGGLTKEQEDALLTYANEFYYEIN